MKTFSLFSSRFPVKCLYVPQASNYDKINIKYPDELEHLFINYLYIEKNESVKIDLPINLKCIHINNIQSPNRKPSMKNEELINRPKFPFGCQIYSHKKIILCLKGIQPMY